MLHNIIHSITYNIYIYIVSIGISSISVFIWASRPDGNWLVNVLRGIQQRSTPAARFVASDVGSDGKP